MCLDTIYTGKNETAALTCSSTGKQSNHRLQKARTDLILDCKVKKYSVKNILNKLIIVEFKSE